ncbi:hypothetical protein HD554DRAFT_2037827 [Boletus coccyginus]|nr:hypothetical protein HD554DRAFT_2037827 [Boletus coccyginus]
MTWDMMQGAVFGIGNGFNDLVPINFGFWKLLIFDLSHLMDILLLLVPSGNMHCMLHGMLFLDDLAALPWGRKVRFSGVTVLVCCMGDDVVWHCKVVSQARSSHHPNAEVPGITSPAMCIVLPDEDGDVLCPCHWLLTMVTCQLVTWMAMTWKYLGPSSLINLIGAFASIPFLMGYLVIHMGRISHPPHHHCPLIHAYKFAGMIDYAAKVVMDKSGRRKVCDLMSGQWAWDQSELIAQDPDTHGATFAPIVLGSNKMTEMSTTILKAHSDYDRIADPAHKDDVNFCHFHRQLFHSSLAAILHLVRDAMIRLVGVHVQNSDLDSGGGPQAHAHTHFPRADIHELIVLDLLHQLIKGTFKDHLVT